MKTILLSIHPTYVDKILSGEKKVEIRKTLPLALYREQGYKCAQPYFFCRAHILLYATAPIKHIIAEAYIHTILLLSQNTLGLVSRDDPASDHSINSTLTVDELLAYKGDAPYLYAWQLVNATKLPTPLPLTSLHIARPPQSWRYLTSTEHAYYERLTTKY